MGIGGTAMGSVAVACARMGHHVTGSDHAVYEPMLSVLAESGIVWHEYGDGTTLLSDPPDLTVVGNAISRGHQELEAILDARLPITSVSAFVGEHLIARNTSIVCAGTHGKTTTSSLAAWILEHALFKPGYLIGGVPHGFDGGCRPVHPDVHNTRAGVFVAEGDEYDTAFFDKRSKFVHYRPTVAILNNLEFDHADIFPTLDAVKNAFSQLVRIVPRNGLILANADDENVQSLLGQAPTTVHTVGLNDQATWRIANVDSQPTHTTWTLDGDSQLGPFTLNMPGLHNVRNASMALLACMFAGVTAEEAQRALLEFVPPKRRLEEIGRWKGAMVVDDFAHHPTAIQATIAAVQQRYRTRIHVVFEPRSNTTTRNVFQNELAECFSGATSVVLGPVHRPERFAEHERLDTVRLIADIQRSGITALSIPTDRSADPQWGADVLSWLEPRVEATDVILLLSNGNIGGLREMLVGKHGAIV